VIKWPSKLPDNCILAPPLVKTIKLDGKYKTTSLFGVKLLKCHFEEKKSIKKFPPKTTSFLIKKKKKEKERRKKKKKNGGLTG
jgi:hypothetical protein